MSAFSGNLGESQRVRLLAFIAIFAVVFGASGGPLASPALATQQPLAQFLWWSDEAEEYTQFGPNEAVTIHTGGMGFVNTCPVPGENDFIWPWADIYIVRSGSAFNGVVLQPLSVVFPKTVQAAGSGGLFGDEVIGYTYPTGAMLQEGQYAVVYDECQDGIFQSDTDALFDPAFRVEIGDTTVPPLDLTEMKAEALDQAASYARLNVSINVLAMAAIPSTSRWQTSLGIVTSLVGVFLDDPVAVLSTHLRNMTRHYLALAQDPPDPAFQQLTEVITPVSGFEPRDSSSIHAATTALAREAATQAALVEAFVHSLERYQGAAAAADGTWALAHARALVNDAALMDVLLSHGANALDSMANEVDANAADLDGAASAMVGLRDRLANETLTADELLLFRSLGLDDNLSVLLQQLTEMDLDTFSASTAAEDLREAADASRASRSDWLAFGAAMASIVDTLSADPTVEDAVPQPVAGGPYSAVAGQPLALSGTSAGAAEIGTAAWDLDTDGEFDDAIGLSPTVAFSVARSGLIGLQVTDVLGRSAVAYATLIVTLPDAPPTIDSRTPVGEPIELAPGATQQFAISASDPDGETPAIEWFVDSEAAGIGPTFELSTTSDDVGVHVVEAVVSAGGQRRITSWAVAVRAPDEDTDSWPSNLDCDDADPTVNPGQAEILLNDKDDDCNPATSDDGQAPTAAFVSSAPGGGRNVALFDSSPFDPNASGSGAAVMASSPVFDGAHTFAKALDIGTEDIAWATTPAAVRYGVVRLWANQTWLIDRVAIMPRIDFPTQRVRDFAVDVSTTGFASEADWTNVLNATAADSGTLQTFVLPGGPVMARYVRVRLLTNRGDSLYFSVEQFKVYTTQQSGGSTFDFTDRSTDPENDIVTRLWNFGDGTTSNLANPSHTYATPGNKTVTLTVTDSRGHQSTTSLVHRVLTPPTGSFSSAGTINEGGQVCNCGYTGGDPDAERIVRLFLDWGDGSPVQVQTNPNSLPHVYPVDGVYTINMGFVDAQEQVTLVSRTVTVLNVAPSATLGNRTVLDALPYEYTVATSDPVDPLTCDWDWGDGTAHAGGCGTQVHAYPAMAPGAPNATYTLTVRVSDDDVTVTRTATVTVIAFEPQPFETEVFYTRWRGGSAANNNVKKVHVTYADATGLSIGTKTNIAWTSGADGIVFAPDGDLIVGGQSNSIFKIDPDTGAYVTRNAGVGSLHVMLDPSGTKVWTSWIPGTPAEVPLNPFSNGTPRPLTGSDTAITSIAWDDDGDAYYTSSGAGGVGSFGRINLTTFQTTRLFSSLPASHGMVFDPYTGWFVLFGSTWITQIDPDTETIVASRNFAPSGFDQGGVDGKGRLFVASGSDLFFVDYSRTGRIDDPANYIFKAFLDPDIDDFAPLVGLGGQPPVALSQSVNTMENTAVPITLGATGVVTSWEIASGPSHGSLSGTAPDLTYTPGVDYHGADAFTFRALNGVTPSNTATVTITIVADDVPPTADAGGPYAILEGGTVTLDATASQDVDGDAMTYAWDLDADGQFDDAVGAVVSFSHDDGPASLSVAVRVTAGAVSATDTAAVAVTNVDPTATLVAPPSVVESGTFAVSLDSAFDPSVADSANLTYAFDCGFGLGYGQFTTATSTTCTAGDDDVDAAVRATVRDDDGGVTEYQAAVAVLNSPPSGTFGATSPILEGSSSALAWTATSDASATDAAALRHSFACDGLVGSLAATWTAAFAASTAPCAFDDNGAFGVLGRLLDPDSAGPTVGAIVQVENVAPSATLLSPATVAEGVGFTLSMTGPADPSTADVAAGFTYAFDCGDGYDFGSFGPSADASCPAATNDGSLGVAARIRDKDGGVRTYSSTITVTNVVPTAGATQNGPKPWGLAVTFTATAADQGASDQANLAINWDLDADGQFDDAAGLVASRSFPTPGTHPARVQVCDDHACVTASTNATITRHATALALGGAAVGTYSDPAGVTLALTDTTVGGSVSGASVSLTIGSQSASATTSGAGIASPPIVLTQPAGVAATSGSFGLTSLYEASGATGSYVIQPETAAVAYAGDTFATGTSARLAATVTESADGSLGDLTRAWVTFDVYVGATACGSGTPTRYGPVAVADTGPIGDGIGSAEITMQTPAEQTYCIVAQVTGGGQTTPNAYYAATPSPVAVLTVVSTTGKFATGGGWIVDPATGGHGNFGFTARFTKSGAPKGQAVYVWRGTYGGVAADLIVKSSSITGLSFADEQGNGTFPWRATMDGKATIRIVRAVDGEALLTDGNATFRLVAVDSGQASGIGVDSFAIRVLDKNGAEFKLVGSWSGPTYAGGVLLSGGNVMIHLR